MRPGRGILGGDNERLLDALLAGVVMDAALALALDALARHGRRLRPLQSARRCV